MHETQDSPEKGSGSNQVQRGASLSRAPGSYRWLAELAATKIKFALSAQQRWRILNGAELLKDVINGETFEDGIRKQAA